MENETREVDEKPFSS